MEAKIAQDIAAQRLADATNREASARPAPRGQPQRNAAALQEKIAANEAAGRMEDARVRKGHLNRA
eukprot:5381093-Heterocapsa_arctica.AAC.1